MNDLIFKHIKLLIVLLLIIGVILQVISANINIETSVLKILQQDGTILTKEILEFPLSKKVLSTLGNLLITLSFALFIAGYINSSVQKKIIETEEIRLKELQKKINQDVHNALFEKIIPKEIFETIKSDIINEEFIRKDGEVFLDFSLDDQDNIHSKIVVIYKVFNNTNKPILPGHSIATFTNLESEKTKMEKIECKMEGKVIAIYDHSEPENSNGVSIEELEDNVLQVSYNFELPSSSFYIDKTIYTNKYKDKVQDDFFTVKPLINLSINANFPLGYKFRIFDVFSPKMECLVDEKGKSIYKVIGGILPKQGFVYFLEKEAAV